MRTTRFVVAGVVSTLLAGSAVLRAQSGAAEAGTPGWVFTPSISFGGLWNDNLLLAHENATPPSDYGTPISPSGTLDYTGRKTRLSGNYGGSFIFYQTLEELNSTDQHVSALFQHRPTSRLTFYVQENFTLAPTTDSLQLAGVPFFRIGSRTNMLGGGMEAALQRKTVLTAGYSLNSVSFEEDEREEAVPLQGGYAHEMLVNLAHALSERVSLGGQYTFRRAILSDGSDRFNIQTGSAALTYKVSPTTKISALLGIAQLGAGLTHEAETGPAIEAGIVHQRRRMTLSAEYQKTFIPSWGFGGTYQNEEWSGSVQVPFARNRGYVSGSVTRYDAEALQVTQPNLRSWFLSSTVGYRATRWLSVEGYFDRAQQDSQLDGGRRRRNEVGFRIVATRPMKLQ